MKVLILSCNTGEGHNTAAKALRAQLLKKGHQAVLVDMMRLKSARVSRVVGDLYIHAAKYTPDLFGAAYHLGDAISAPDRKSPVYYANSGLKKCLQNYLQEHDCDVIATTHLYGAELLTYMKRQGMLRQKTVAIATDYTCIPFWEETRCDAYVVGHEDLIPEFVQKGIPREKLYPLGIPVDPAYTSPKSAAAAKAALGFSPADALAVVMGGSMAFGEMRQFARLAAAGLRGTQIAVLCGRDGRLLDQMRQEAEQIPTLHPVGYTHQVPLYLDAADLLFTKPGGLTSTEALCKGVPIVHTAPIPGCETANLRFFCSRGLSLTGANASEQIAAGHRLLHQCDLREQMKAAQQRNAKPNAAAACTALLCKLAGEERI